MKSESTSQNHPAEQTQPDNLCLPLPGPFAAVREWPDEIIVEPARLASNLWGDTEGDITAAYSADKRPKIKTFLHEGQRFTNMGGSAYSVNCYPLLLPGQYKGTGKKPYSYEGETVIHDRQTFTLGSKIKFIARPLTFDEEVSFLRRSYAYGGYFAAGKTYQQVLTKFLDRHGITAGEVTAINAELAREGLPQTQPEMLEQLGMSPDQREGSEDDTPDGQTTLPGMDFGDD